MLKHTCLVFGRQLIQDLDQFTNDRERQKFCFAALERTKGVQLRVDDYVLKVALLVAATVELEWHDDSGQPRGITRKEQVAELFSQFRLGKDESNLSRNERLGRLLLRGVRAGMSFSGSAARYIAMLPLGQDRAFEVWQEFEAALGGVPETAVVKEKVKQLRSNSKSRTSAKPKKVPALGVEKSYSVLLGLLPATAEMELARRHLESFRDAVHLGRNPLPKGWTGLPNHAAAQTAVAPEKVSAKDPAPEEQVAQPVGVAPVHAGDPLGRQAAASPPAAGRLPSLGWPPGEGDGVQQATYPITDDDDCFVWLPDRYAPETFRRCSGAPGGRSFSL